jgi:O-antigen ligase
MGEKMKTLDLRNKINWVLLSALLFSAFLVPNIRLINHFAKIHVTDILIPFFLAAIFMNYNPKAFPAAKNFIIAICLMTFIAFISLLVNRHLFIFRDDFEVMKFVKLLIVFLFVMVSVQGKDFIKMLRIIFILVVIFNFLHYTNLFDFNEHILKYYGQEIQVDTFGLNSLGQPDTKRIIGTVGNPNNNAILFLFFTIFFFPELKSTWKEKIYFLLAALGVFACQSRTGLVAFIAIFILGSVVKKYNLKAAGLYLLGFVGMFLGLMLLGNVYLNSLASNLMKQHSVRGRLETWKMLWEMIKQKPIIGYSPSKDYFDENNIYSESEYFLFAWRFGFLGLFAYLYMTFSGFYAGFKARLTNNGFRFAAFSIVIIITAFTNNPLSDPMIFMMYAFSAGLFFSDRLKVREVTV